jgi:hypothetical protein
MKRVAIVVPTYKTELSADEQLSLRHLQHFLGAYDIFYVAPRGLQIKYYSYPTVDFPPRYFTSLDAYSRLMLLPEFYRAFAGYEYILVYQLDCLVFSDQLMEWCGKGYDYIGAPWLAGQGAGYNKEDCVGNGGFSLRRVEAFIKVSGAYQARSPWTALERFLRAAASPRLFSEPFIWFGILRQAWREAPFSSFVPTEDYFWSFMAKDYYKEFRIAPVAEALKFSFEVGPRYCFERNHKQLPFGCHAWAKWDKEFWQPYLLK